MIATSGTWRPCRAELEPDPDLESMAAAILICPKCHHALSTLPAAELAGLSACPECGTALEISLFPAYGRGPNVGQPGVNRVSDTDAACFFHPSKRAEVPCDRCGRFLCALCQLELEGQNLCPSCLTSGSQAGKILALEKARFRWDSLVWLLVLGPPFSICFAALTPLTCLAALVIGLWKFRSPPSRIHRSQGRLIGGMLTSVATLLGVVALFIIGLSQEF